MYTESNSVIKISQEELMKQAASLGTPVTDVLTSPAFIQVVPGGFVLPEVGEPGSNGANVAYFSITSISLMLLATIFFF